MQPKLITTADGSQTLQLEEMDETYHSTNGALTEAQHVFINNGLLKSSHSSLRILEVGFGTGLNALVTLDALYKQTTIENVHYTTLEKYPVPAEIYNKLNYGQLVSPDLTTEFNLLHQAAWEEEVNINKHFTIHKRRFDLLEQKLEGEFDLIYYDAFAPSKQSPMWEDKILKKVCDTLKPGGIFSTYCAKGSVRRALQSFELEMERLPGPPGKREMLLGIKN